MHLLKMDDPNHNLVFIIAINSHYYYNAIRILRVFNQNTNLDPHNLILLLPHNGIHTYLKLKCHNTIARPNSQYSPLKVQK